MNLFLSFFFSFTVPKGGLLIFLYKQLEKADSAANKRKLEKSQPTCLSLSMRPWSKSQGDQPESRQRHRNQGLIKRGLKFGCLQDWRYHLHAALCYTWGTYRGPQMRHTHTLNSLKIVIIGSAWSKSEGEEGEEEGRCCNRGIVMIKGITCLEHAFILQPAIDPYVECRVYHV